jgi:hypothetical protein
VGRERGAAPLGVSRTGQFSGLPVAPLSRPTRSDRAGMGPVRDRCAEPVGNHETGNTGNSGCDRDRAGSSDDGRPRPGFEDPRG